MCSDVIPSIVDGMTHNEAIAAKARGVAAEMRFTQQRIADVLGITRGSVSARMNGTVAFTAPEILAFADAAGVEVGRFFPELVPR